MKNEQHAIFELRDISSIRNKTFDTSKLEKAERLEFYLHWYFKLSSSAELTDEDAIILADIISRVPEDLSELYINFE